MESLIDKLTDSSREVLMNSALPNGAIVAASSILPDYPKDAKNYFYVWPRDACFVSVASDILGMVNISNSYFEWLVDRAEGWSESGLFYEKYYPNGLQALGRFQPDQTGTVLMAVAQHIKLTEQDPEKYSRLIKRSAEGLCKVWDGDHFSLVSNDLWEERMCFPDLRENFTYSLAACAGGLSEANKLFPDERFATVASEMLESINKSAVKGSFCRSFGVMNDERIDASLMGLVWPFRVIDAHDPRWAETMKLIEERLVRNEGVYRYEGDEYDGWMYAGLHRNKGAGFWPLLNFWMSIIKSKMGEEKSAKEYLMKGIESVERYIPEQVFPNGVQKSVSPLAWAHAMYVLASKELGLI